MTTMITSIQISHSIIIFILSTIQWMTPFIYILLSITAISSLYIQSLSHLASHGKLHQKRQHQEDEQEDQQQHGDEKTIKNEKIHHKKNHNLDNGNDENFKQKYFHLQSKKVTSSCCATTNTWLSQVIHYIIYNESFQISKQNFIHFYIFGFVWTIFIMMMTMICFFSTSWSSIIDDSHNMINGGGSSSSGSGIRIRKKKDNEILSMLLLFLLLLIHLGRRIYECTYIHIHQHTRKRQEQQRKSSSIDDDDDYYYYYYYYSSSSDSASSCSRSNSCSSFGTMHVAGWFLGILHYFLLPFNFLSLTHYNNTYTTSSYTSNMEFIHNNYDDNNDEMYTNDMNRTRISYVIKVVGVCSMILFNLYGQMEQYLHHVLLAQCRHIVHHYQNNQHQQNNNMNLCNVNHNCKSRYSIPYGRWFNYISCPHYTAEIMIYLSFATLIHLLHPSSPSSTLHYNVHHQCFPSDNTIMTTSSSLPLLSSFLISGKWIAWIQRNSHWILALWVIINLSISAKKTHQWYHLYFKHVYPNGRYALIPFVW